MTESGDVKQQTIIQNFGDIKAELQGNKSNFTTT